MTVLIVYQVCMGLEKRLQQLNSSTIHSKAQTATVAITAVKTAANTHHDADASLNQIDSVVQVVHSSNINCTNIHVTADFAHETLMSLLE
jgi:hypothetical protein